MRFPKNSTPAVMLLALPFAAGCQAAISLWGNLAMLALSVGIFCATILFRSPG